MDRTRLFDFRRRGQEDRQSILGQQSGVETIDVVQEATNDDHLVPLDVLERRYETSTVRGLTEEQV